MDLLYFGRRLFVTRIYSQTSFCDSLLTQSPDIFLSETWKISVNNIYCIISLFIGKQSYTIPQYRSYVSVSNSIPVQNIQTLINLMGISRLEWQKKNKFKIQEHAQKCIDLNERKDECQ